MLKKFVVRIYFCEIPDAWLPHLQCAPRLASRSRSLSATHASRNPHLTPDPLPEGEGIDSLLPLGEGAGMSEERFMYSIEVKWIEEILYHNSRQTVWRTE